MRSGKVPENVLALGCSGTAQTVQMVNPRIAMPVCRQSALWSAKDGEDMSYRENARPFSTGQIAELIAIDRKRPIGAQVQELISRLTSGGVAGKSTDLRTVQAKRLFDAGWGRELGIDSFDAYLKIIPQIKGWPKEWEEAPCLPAGRFNRTILVDARIPLTTACRFAGLKFTGNDKTFQNHESIPELSDVYWIRCQDGRKNRGKTPCNCRNSFPKDERGLTAFEGVSLYAQHPEVINGHYVDLVGSVDAEDDRHVASLGHWRGKPGLHWGGSDGEDPRYGSASAGVVL